MKYIETPEEVYQQLRNTNGLVVLHFTVVECGRCEHIAPLYEMLAKKFPQVLFMKINMDENMTITYDYRVMNPSTFILIKHGETRARLSYCSIEKVQRKIRELLAEGL